MFYKHRQYQVGKDGNNFGLPGDARVVEGWILLQQPNYKNRLRAHAYYSGGVIYITKNRLGHK